MTRREQLEALLKDMADDDFEKLIAYAILLKECRAAGVLIPSKD